MRPILRFGSGAMPAERRPASLIDPTVKHGTAGHGLA
jgi:hypothetical protein